MLKNHFILAFRHLLKQKMYSAIKIGGFALSIAACLLIALYIRDELSYDQSYPDTGRIYRITGEYKNTGKLETGADWPAPMAKALKEDFPEVAIAGRLMPHELFYGAGSNEVRRTDVVENNYEDRFTYADQAMLEILQLPMIYGDRAHALAGPNTMVITKKKADKYFPNENPVGKTLILNNDKSRVYTIGGVIQDLPATSHIQYDFWLTLSGHQFWPGEQTLWTAQNYYTYVLLKPGTHAAQLQGKLGLLLKKYFIPALRKDGNTEVESIEKNSRFLLQPISDVHLGYGIDDELPHGDPRFVWLFGSIACFILVLACINFINLSTAKSANRAREVGLRKVVGSTRGSLVRQFLAESLLFSCLSFMGALLLAAALLPYFNALSAKSLTIPWGAWWLLPTILGAALVVGILSGLYPSFYLSSFKPIQVLKGVVSRGSKNSLLRNALIVFQFATSIILIISTIIIYEQMQFILHRKTGFDKDQVVLIQGAYTLENEVKSFKNELLKQPPVKSVSVSDFLPVSGTKRNGNTFWKEGKQKEESGVSAQSWTVDDDYLSTMGMKLTAGRNFSFDIPSDSQAVIINQAMAARLNLKDPVGKRVTTGWATFNVIGVVEDFHFESMRTNIQPLSMHLGNSPSIISVKVNTGDIKKALSSITAVWKRYAPNQPIRYTFLDESYANMYADVQRMGQIFSSFAVLAIIIACLGLFALSAFMAEQRTKEIGIRKVLGASVRGITTLLSKDFVRLVIIAIVIASPVTWWAMNQWLRDFAYHISISWWMFLAAGCMAVLIALVTVSFQSVKAALENPVKNLRAE